jgi:hypothetical protein
MNKLLPVLLLLAACAEPIGEDESGRPEIQMVYEAWTEARLGDLTSCGAQHWARVSPEEFKDVCGSYSCAHSGVGSCTMACTPADDVATAYWDETAQPNDKGAESFARAHEQVHAWLACTTGNADKDHTSRAWSVLHDIERDLRSIDPSKATN